MAKNKSKKHAKKKAKSRSKKKAANAPQTAMRNAQSALARPLSTETRGAEAATVFWLLTGFTTAMAELAWCVLRATRTQFDDAERWLALHGIVAAIALLTGLVTLIMTVAAIRVRSARPPQGIVTTMIIIGVIPMIVLLISSLRS